LSLDSGLMLMIIELHFLLSFFLFLLYRHYTMDSLDCKRKIQIFVSRNFDKTFSIFHIVWHTICYMQVSCQNRMARDLLRQFVVSRCSVSTYVDFSAAILM
jgi:hypothetical protein